MHIELPGQQIWPRLGFHANPSQARAQYARECACTRDVSRTLLEPCRSDMPLCKVELGFSSSILLCKAIFLNVHLLSNSRYFAACEASLHTSSDTLLSLHRHLMSAQQPQWATPLMRLSLSLVWLRGVRGNNGTPLSIPSGNYGRKLVSVKIAAQFANFNSLPLNQ